MGECDTLWFLEKNCSSLLVIEGGEDFDVPSLGYLTDGEFLLLSHRSQEEWRVEKQVSIVSSS